MKGRKKVRKNLKLMDGRTTDGVFHTHTQKKESLVVFFFCFLHSTERDLNFKWKKNLENNIN